MKDISKAWLDSSEYKMVAAGDEEMREWKYCSGKKIKQMILYLMLEKNCFYYYGNKCDVLT